MFLAQIFFKRNVFTLKCSEHKMRVQNFTKYVTYYMFLLQNPKIFLDKMRFILVEMHLLGKIHFFLGELHFVPKFKNFVWVKCTQCKTFLGKVFCANCQSGIVDGPFYYALVYVCFVYVYGMIAKLTSFYLFDFSTEFSRSIKLKKPFSRKNTGKVSMFHNT